MAELKAGGKRSRPFEKDIRNLRGRSVSTLRDFDDGTRTVKISGTDPRGRYTEINVRAGKGSGKNSRTGGAG